MDDSLAGQLLLASPALDDPNFRRTVVLIGVHSEEGAMGVVLNRPSEVTVGEAVPQLEQAVAEQEPVYVGGPVQPTSIVFLAEFLDPSPAGLLVLGRIGFPAPDADIDELTDATARGRVFAGYAGWGEGQLDAEVDHGDWIAQTALPEDVFTDVPVGAVEHGAHAQGRRLCAARAHAHRPERQLIDLMHPEPLNRCFVSSEDAQARSLVDDPPQVRRSRLDPRADRRQRPRPVGRDLLLEQLHAAQLRLPASGRPVAEELPGAGRRPRHDRLPGCDRHACTDPAVRATDERDVRPGRQAARTSRP